MLLVNIIYRHSDEMIEKLESAGLGFYVKATKTNQKLGIDNNNNNNTLQLLLLYYMLFQVKYHSVN